MNKLSRVVHFSFKIIYVYMNIYIYICLEDIYTARSIQWGWVDAEGIEFLGFKCNKEKFCWYNLMLLSHLPEHMLELFETRDYPM